MLGALGADWTSPRGPVITGRWCVKAVRGEEQEEESAMAAQKAAFSDFFKAPAGDALPAKNHDDEEQLRGRAF